MAEIVVDGRICVYNMMDDELDMVDDIVQRSLFRRSNPVMDRNETDDKLVRAAWETYVLYDFNARRQKFIARMLTIIIILLNVLATIVAVTQQQLRSDGTIIEDDTADTVLSVTVTAIPIVSAGVISANNKFGAGTKWMGLRGGAQHIIKEILRFRSRVGDYESLKWTGPEKRSARFAERVEDIRQGLNAGDVYSSALKQATSDMADFILARDTHQDSEWEDDLYSQLNPAEYYRVRLLPQIAYYMNKTPVLERRLRILQWTTYVLGAGAAILGFIGYQLWIAVTGAFIAAIATYLEYERIATLLVQFNRTVVELNKLKDWWNSLMPVERAAPGNFFLLVEGVEMVLDKEVSSWMSSATASDKAGEDEDEDEDVYVPKLIDFQLPGRREKLFQLLNRMFQPATGFVFPEKPKPAK